MKELAEGSGLAAAGAWVWFPAGTVPLVAQSAWEREAAAAVGQSSAQPGLQPAPLRNRTARPSAAPGLAQEAADKYFSRQQVLFCSRES